MKKTTVWHFAMYTIAIIVAFVLALHLTSCESRSGAAVRAEQDSIRVTEQIKDFVDPRFDNISEVLSYKDELNTNEYEDSVFRSLPSTTVYNIATVVINRDGHATKTSIVKEYEKAKEIYDGLPKSIPDSIIHPIEVNGHKSAEITSKDTMIGGKKAHIKTVTEYE